MKHYVLSGKVTDMLYDQILLDIDQNKEFKLTIGYGLDASEINKIAALGVPVHIRGEIWNDELSETTQLLHRNLAECVLIEFLVNKNSISRLNEVIQEMNEKPDLFGAKLLLREWPLEFLKIPDEDWNKLIVTISDHEIEMCWDEDKFAATHRYLDYVKEMI